MPTRLLLRQSGLVLALCLTLAACNYPRATQPVSTPPVQPTVIVLPSQPATSQPTQAVQPTLAAPTAVPTSTQPTPQPTQAVPTQAPPVPTATLAPTSAPTITTVKTYQVVFVTANDALNVRQAAGPTQTVVGTLRYDATGITSTGRETAVNGQRWVEINRPGGGTGWVNAAYLIEQVDSSTICSDPQVDTLLANLKTALANQDGDLLGSLVSPQHGLRLTYLRGGTVAVYTPDEAAWLFKSSYQTDWGLHPGSGEPLKATFSTEVRPRLLDVLNASYAESCNTITTGGTTYTATWPAEYRNLPYLALHRAGASGDELNWRTWLVGIVYHGGKPYLAALNHLQWEP